MTHRSNSELPPKLLQGRQAFEQWRSKKKTRRQLPDHLWSLAVDLAREYGFSKTAQTLRLEYNKLKSKSRLLEVPSNRPNPGPAGTFLELQSDEVLTQFECTIDCQRGPSQTIRIQLKGPHWPEITGLCERLWGMLE